MKILNLQVENIKKIKVVEIKPDGNIVVIGGNNGSGKSSTLDSIMFALAGKRSLPDMPVSHGEESGRITITLDDDYIIEREVRALDDHTTLRLFNKNGAQYGSPQKILDGFCAKFSLDPLAFKNFEKKKRVDIVKELAGVNTAEVDARIERERQERLFLKRDCERLETELQGRDYSNAAAVAKVDPAPVMAAIDNSNQAHLFKSNLVHQLNQINAMLGRTNQDIADFQARLDKLHREKGQLELDVVNMQNQINITPDAQPVESLQFELTKITQHNSEVDRYFFEKTKWDELQVRKTSLETSDGLVKQYETERKNMIASVQLPVAGLTFDDDGLYFNGIPFEQCSAGEQLKISTCMGIALNPTLKVLLIRDGSLLDEHNLAIVADIAAQHDAQIWIERVGDGAECSVVLEDGLVKENRLQVAA